MPHFIVECPKALQSVVDLNKVIEVTHQAAQDSGLFTVRDIKVRLLPLDFVLCGGNKDQEPFVHVTCAIMSGRTDVQKKTLSRLVCQAIHTLLPHVMYISAEVRDLHRETYSNKSDCL